MGDGPALVVGHSFGGVTALAATAQAPDLVRGLMLYETSVAWAPGWDDTVMGEVLASKHPEEAALRLMLGSRYDALTGEDRHRRLREGRAFIAEERSVRSGGATFDLASITCPVLYGRSSVSVMPEVVDYLRGALVGFHEEILPGAGHHAHRSDPERFAGLIRRALELVNQQHSL